MDVEMLEGGEQATEETQATGVEEQAGNQGNKGQQEPEKKYTDEDLDRIIAKKIAAERKRMQRVFNEEQQENEIEIRERNVLKRELMADAKDRLVEHGLPYTLSNLMSYEDKDAFEKSYQEVTGIFIKAVQRGVTDALKGNPPKVSTGGRKDDIAKAFAPKTR